MYQFACSLRCRCNQQRSVWSTSLLFLFDINPCWTSRRIYKETLHANAASLRRAQVHRIVIHRDLHVSPDVCATDEKQSQDSFGGRESTGTQKGLIGKVFLAVSSSRNPLDLPKGGPALAPRGWRGLGWRMDGGVKRRWQGRRTVDVASEPAETISARPRRLEATMTTTTTTTYRRPTSPRR